MDKTTCACGPGCSCGCGNGHRVIWWVVGIAILVFVFALGVKAGELRDELRSAFGNNYYRGYPMMQRVYSNEGAVVPVNGMPQDVATGTSAAPMMPVQQ